jgi:hypothetical protein
MIHIRTRGASLQNALQEIYSQLQRLARVVATTRRRWRLISFILLLSVSALGVVIGIGRWSCWGLRCLCLWQTFECVLKGIDGK